MHGCPLTLLMSQPPNTIIIQQSMADLDKKIVDTIRQHKCARKSCLSTNQDQLEVVWFGNKFDLKDLTCTSCVLMNDDLLRGLEPAAHNILPLSAFVHKFSSEYQEYTKLKKSKDWRPRLLEARKEEIKKEMEAFEKTLHNSLKGLVDSLQRLLVRVTEKSTEVFKVSELDEIEKMNNEGNFGQLFSQIQILMKHMQRVGEQSHKFVDEKVTGLNNDKLRKVLSEVSQMVGKTLSSLSKQLRVKVEEVSRV